MSVYQRTSSCSPSVEGKLSPGKLLTMQHFPAQLLTAGGVGCVGGSRVNGLKSCPLCLTLISWPEVSMHLPRMPFACHENEMEMRLGAGSLN